jgi:hypothetical protein
MSANSSFSQVRSNVSGSVVDNISASVVQSNNSSLGNSLVSEQGPSLIPLVNSDGNVKIDPTRVKKVVGYSPVPLSAAGTDDFAFLDVQNGVAATVITDNRILRIPDGAEVLKVFLQNNTATDITGPTALNVALNSTIAVAGGNNLFTTIVLDSINAGGTVEQSAPAVPFGAAGPTGAGAGLPVTVGNNLVIGDFTGAGANEAGAEVKIVIWYICPN